MEQHAAIFLVTMTLSTVKQINSYEHRLTVKIGAKIIQFTI